MPFVDEIERERLIDEVPVEDHEAALRALVATLDDGELDEELCQVLAFRTGDPAAFWGSLVDARAAWRSAHNLPPAPMPFALGE